MLEEIKEIAYAVGQMFLERETFKTDEKAGSNNIVTSMDLKAQEYIIKECQKILPEANFIAEEKENIVLSDEYTWIIDPLDGTTNFAYDYQFSAVSIALAKNREVIYGVVYNPYLDQMFSAEKGKGSYLNDQKLSVSNFELKDALLAVGTSPYNKDKSSITFAKLQKCFENARDLRRSGSAALDICYVASGKVDGFYEEVLAIWDYAAASLILSEAGGEIAAYGVELFKELNAVTVVGSNGKFQLELANIVK